MRCPCLSGHNTGFFGDTMIFIAALFVFLSGMILGIVFTIALDK